MFLGLAAESPFSRFLTTFIAEPGPIERFEPFVSPARGIAENINSECPLLERERFVALQKLLDKVKEDLEWVVPEHGGPAVAPGIIVNLEDETHTILRKGVVLVEEVLHQAGELRINVSQHATEIVDLLTLRDDPLEIVHDAVRMVRAWLRADGMNGGTSLEDTEVELHGGLSDV